MLFILALSPQTARLASLFWYFLLASHFFAADDPQSLANCVTWYSFFFAQHIFIPSLFFLSFSLPNKGWCSRYSLWVCLLFLFLSLIFLMCFCKTDGVFLNSCPLPLKCILANYLPILTIFTMSLSPFLVLISQINSLKSWSLIAVYTAEAGMLSAHYAAVSLTLK